MPRVLIAGHITLDRYGDDLLPGGGAFYCARTHLGLGAQVRLAAAVGDDFTTDLTSPGLELTVARAGRTTVFTNVYPPGAPRIQRVDAVAPAMQPEMLPDSWREADVLHLTPVMGELDLERWTAAVRARIVGIGVQGWVREADAEGVVRPRRWEPEASLLERVQVACVGEEDLAGQPALLERLVAAVPIVAFTHGVHGCELIERGKVTRLEAFRTRDVDPTGAGDTFAAGLLLGLARGLQPVEAARLGSGAASIVIEGRGAEALTRLDEAEERARQITTH